MAAHLTIIAGLPGAGKSTLIDRIATEYAGVVAHDFMDKAASEEDFSSSIHFASLIRDLAAGKRCLIADVVFCNPVKRDKVKRVIDGMVPGVVLQEVFFSNDLDGCLANIDRRAKIKPDPNRNIEFEKRVARELSAIYVIPDGVSMIPVYRTKTP